MLSRLELKSNDFPRTDVRDFDVWIRAGVVLKHLAWALAVFVEEAPGLCILAIIASRIGIGPLTILKADANMFSASLGRQEYFAVLRCVSAAQSIPGIEIPVVRDDKCSHREDGQHGEVHDEKNDPPPDGLGAYVVVCDSYIHPWMVQGVFRFRKSCYFRSKPWFGWEC